ncbi:MAG: hypothetical protein HUJ68_12505 [Clostridia bacterium]|mgnify:CR=1 FL=1|nr:hypothetical protein [Clostridia bacterium]
MEEVMRAFIKEKGLEKEYDSCLEKCDYLRIDLAVMCGGDRHHDVSFCFCKPDFDFFKKWADSLEDEDDEDEDDDFIEIGYDEIGTGVITPHAIKQIFSVWGEHEFEWGWDSSRGRVYRSNEKLDYYDNGLKAIYKMAIKWAEENGIEKPETLEEDWL